jgi:hypothetical protein
MRIHPHPHTTPTHYFKKQVSQDIVEGGGKQERVVVREEDQQNKVLEQTHCRSFKEYIVIDN